MRKQALSKQIGLSSYAWKMNVAQNRRRPANAGFAIIDVAMGATILVVGFVGLIQAVTIGTEMLDTSRKQLVAQQLVDHEIERMRMADWSTLGTLGAGTTYTIGVNTTGTALTGTNTSKARFALANYNTTATDDYLALMAVAKGFTLTATAVIERTDYRSVTYTVTWTGVTGRSHTWICIATFGKYGLQTSYQKA